MRRGLEELLTASGEITVVGSAADGSQALAEVARTTPDVVLMDLSMPVLDGVEATKQITAAHPDVKVVVLTSFADHVKVIDAIEAGAAGYLLKDAEPDDVIAAVRAAHAGGAP